MDHRKFKIKLLRFKRNSKLSKQYHEHRNELWLFLRGSGIFYHGAAYFPMWPGDWVLTQKGELHRFITKEDSCLALEIQYGEKCEEGDITRV